MPTHAWQCPACHRKIGRIVTGMLRPAELHVTLPGVVVESTRRGHWVIECVCHRPLAFDGRSVHYDIEREVHHRK